MSVVKLEECRERLRTELDNVVDFWLKYSHDSVHGGFFTCIGKDGKVYDELKYVWLQGRQVWMYCRLYRTMDRFHKPEILEAAKAGGAFLRKFARVPGTSSGQWKCAFCLTRDGKAVKIQRTIFSECFYIMAMDELSRVTGDEDMQLEAENMMKQLIYWVQKDSSGLGRPQLPGDIPINSMAVPMMLLCLVQQLVEGRGQEVVQKYRELGSWCVQQILQHIQRNGTAILENVSPEGSELPGCLGRLQNPGHALEAGWFLLQFSAEWGDEELQRTAIDKFVELPYQYGWDKEHGGLFYFLDVDGHCPTQLESSMKLWWPHCEALIAFLMAYSQTKRPELLERFSQVYEYTFSHFPDAKSGEWFGYLTQEGRVALDLKGGPFKALLDRHCLRFCVCCCCSPPCAECRCRFPIHVFCRTFLRALLLLVLNKMRALIPARSRMLFYNILDLAIFTCTFVAYITDSGFAFAPLKVPAPMCMVLRMQTFFLSFPCLQPLSSQDRRSSYRGLASSLPHQQTVPFSNLESSEQTDADSSSITQGPDLKQLPQHWFFHVPRCLYMCERILDDLLATKDSAI